MINRSGKLTGSAFVRKNKDYYYKRYGRKTPSARANIDVTRLELAKNALLAKKKAMIRASLARIAKRNEGSSISTDT